MVKVLIADKLPREIYAPLLKEAGIEFSDDILSSELEKVIKDYEVLWVRSKPEVTASLISKAAKLRLIIRGGTGDDNIDKEAATLREIVVENTPDANSISAAEHTTALMYALARNISFADASMKAGRWDKSKYIGVELRGKRLGVVGLGKIGGEVAKRAKEDGMEVVYHDPYVPEEKVKGLNYTKLELDELLRTSDFVTIHVPLSDRTRGMMDRSVFETMKEGAYFLNVARGELVDEDALIESLESGKLAGAAIDVYPKEPYPKEGKLRELGDKVILTPHLAASTGEALQNVAKDAANQTIAFISEGRIINAVNYIPIDSRLQNYIKTLQRMGKFLAPYATEGLENLTITYSAQYIPDDLKIKGISRPVLTELLSGKLENVNAMNADEKAESLGIKVNESVGAEKSVYGNLFRVDIVYKEKDKSKNLVIEASSITPDRPLLVNMSGYEPGFDLIGHVLFFEYIDRPGVLATLTEKTHKLNINIDVIKALKHESGKTALTLMRLAEPISKDTLNSMAEEIGAIRAHQYNFNS